MAKDLPADPPEDIPAWFMTYSDVITLLMTFFILLLTFSTTEPERFEKVPTTFLGSSGATGVAGHKQKSLDRDSWTQRVRPRAARIALHGSEMPPEVSQPSTVAVGRGLQAANEKESEKDVMRVYAFELDLKTLVDHRMQVSQYGMQIAAKISKQIRSLPVHCALEVSSEQNSKRAIAMAYYLYQVEKVRPGQVAVGIVPDVDSSKLRFVIERYEL